MTGPVTIVGAGIAGLALAIRCRQLGMNVSVFEARSRKSEDGAGIQLGPNAVHVLRGLGCLPDLQTRAATPDAITVRSGQSGSILQRLPLGKWIEKRHGAPYLVVHRADLQNVLLKQATDTLKIPITYGVRVSKISDLDDRVVIAADGIWSAARTCIEANANQLVSFRGRCAARTLVARGAVPPELDANTVGAWLSPHGHLVHYPVRGGEEIAIVLVTKQAEVKRGWGEAIASQTAAMALGRIAPKLDPTWTQTADWRQWPLYDTDRALAWHRGKLALIGDAAHPILPFLAQGGAMALEDAWCMGTYLARGPNPTHAFAMFEQARRARIAKVQDASRRNGRIFHLGWPASTARNVAMRTLPATTVMAGFDWLYGWKPDDAPSS